MLLFVKVTLAIHSLKATSFTAQRLKGTKLPGGTLALVAVVIAGMYATLTSRLTLVMNWSVERKMLCKHITDMMEFLH